MRLQKLFKQFSTFLLLLFLPVVVTSQSSSVVYQADEAGSDDAKFEQWLGEQKPALLNPLWKQFDEKGNAAFDKGDLSSAENQFGKANLIARKLNDQLLIAKSLHELGRVTRAQGDAGKTQEFFAAAEQILRQQNDKNAQIELGLLLTDFSNLYVLKRETNAALQAANEAREIAATFSDELLSARASNVLGAAFRQQGNIVSAIVWLEKSQDILAKHKNSDPYASGDAALRLSLIYGAQGEYKLALQNLQAAEKSFTVLNQPLQNLQLWRAMAGFFNNYGQTNEAVRYLEKTCALATKLGMTRRTVGCQMDLGLTYLWEKNFQKAAPLLEAAEKEALQINADDLRVPILIGKAFIAGNNNQFRNSLEMFAKAEILAEQKGEWDDKLTLNWFKASVLLKQGSLADALAAAEKAVSLAEAHQDADSLAYLFELKAQILLAQNQKRAARETLNQAVDFVEQGRTQLNNAASSTGFLNERSDSYRNLLELNLEENNVADALIIADNLKSRWLNDRLAKANVGALQSKSWQTTDEAKELRREIYRASEKYLENALDNNGELLALEKKYQEKIENFRASTNHKFDLSKSKFTTQELTSLVNNQTAIVFFAVTANNQVAAFVIRQTGIKVFRLNANYSEIAANIRAFRQEITVPDPAFKKSAKSLYADLLSPIERDLATVENLIIVPDLGLWELPFQALIASDGKYLVEKYQVSYVPSLRLYQTLQRLKNKQEPVLLAFGNSVIEPAKQLKQAEREVVSIGEIYRQSAVYTKETATESRFKSATDTADLIHLAVHGEMNAGNPFDSALLLTKDQDNDGRLTVGEIIQLPRLPNSLVVLSGCDTSNGQVLSGEGLLSLSWAFLAAGANRVVAAQWAVEERTTADLMTDFHLHLKRNPAQTAAALRTAQLTALKNPFPFNHPFYWAGFVVVGADLQR